MMIYYINIKNLMQAADRLCLPSASFEIQYRIFLSLLDPAVQTRILRYRKETDRLRSLASQLLLYHAFCISGQKKFFNFLWSFWKTFLQRLSCLQFQSLTLRFIRSMCIYGGYSSRWNRHSGISFSEQGQNPCAFLYRSRKRTGRIC